MGFWKELFNLKSDDSDDDKDNKLYYEIYTLCKNCGQQQNYKILKGKKAQEELLETSCRNCKNKSLEKTEEQSLSLFINNENEINPF